MTDKQDRTIVEMTIAAPIETVWAAMREPGQLLNWFGWDADTLRDEIKFWVPTVPVQNLMAGAVTQVSVVRFDEQPRSPEVA